MGIRDWIARHVRRPVPQSSEAPVTLDSLRDKLGEMNDERDAQSRAAEVVKAFAAVLESSSEHILDAKRLPFPKNAIMEAITTRIRFFERCTAQDPDKASYSEELDLHRTIAQHVHDFQAIDPEDETAVVQANDGELDERMFLLLCLKYYQRAMREAGLPVNDPLEGPGEHTVCGVVPLQGFVATTPVAFTNLIVAYTQEEEPLPDELGDYLSNRRRA